MLSLLCALLLGTTGAAPLSSAPDTTDAASPPDAEERSVYVDPVSWHVRDGADGTAEDLLLLTIDDGPRPDTTPDLLELLEAHDVPALFFINGEPAATHPELIHAILEDGHAIGNHTWSHANLAELPADSARHEIVAVNEWLQEEADHTPTYFRPPYGVSSPAVDSVVRAEEMEPMGWSAESYDWLYEDESDTMREDAEAIAERTLESLTNGNILLIHDRPVAVEALEIILNALAEDEVEFVLPDEAGAGMP